MVYFFFSFLLIYRSMRVSRFFYSSNFTFLYRTKKQVLRNSKVNPIKFIVLMFIMVVDLNSSIKYFCLFLCYIFPFGSYWSSLTLASQY